MCGVCEGKETREGSIMRYLWRKLWYDLGHGWKCCYTNGFVAVSMGLLYIAGASGAGCIEYIAVFFTLLLAWGAPLQIDKAMHLCPMSRRETRQYLKQYYWLRFGVCFGISALAQLVLVAVGWQSPAFAGMELFLLAFFTMAVLSTSLPAAKDRKADSSGDSRWSVENCIPFKKEYIGIFVLFFMMAVRIMLFQDIQQELREQKVPDGAECWAAAVLAVMGIVAAGVYIAGVLPKILTECSDYEGSCVYFRVE